MTQTPDPHHEATRPAAAATPETPTVAFRAVPTPPATPTQPTEAVRPGTPYPTPAAPTPSRYVARATSPYAAPATSPYAAPTQPAVSPYAAPAQPASPYAAPTQPASPYAAPAQPASPYAAPAQPASPYPATAPYSAPAAPTPSRYAAPSAPPASPYAVPATPAAQQPYPTPVTDGTPPTATPYAVPPVSGQPAHGYPYADQPLSGPPLSGPPYGMPPATAPKPRRTAVIVLSIATALLFVASGVLGGMFVVQRGETNRGNDQIAAQRTDLTAKAKKIEELQANLDSVNSESIIKQQELDGSKNDRDEQERQKKVISKCLDLLLEAFSQETESQFDKKIRAAEKTCDEADTYM